MTTNPEFDIAFHTIRQFGTADILETGSAKLRNVIAWLQNFFPMAWSRIDWDQVARKCCYRFETEAELQVAATSTRNFLALSGDDSVVVFWYDGSLPGIALSAENAMRHLSILFSVSEDTWLVSKTGGWCIEIHHDWEICGGRTGPRTIRELKT